MGSLDYSIQRFLRRGKVTKKNSIGTKKVRGCLVQIFDTAKYDPFSWPELNFSKPEKLFTFTYYGSDILRGFLSYDNTEFEYKFIPVEYNITEWPYPSLRKRLAAFGIYVRGRSRKYKTEIIHSSLNAWTDDSESLRRGYSGYTMYSEPSKWITLYHLLSPEQKELDLVVDEQPDLNTNSINKPQPIKYKWVTMSDANTTVTMNTTAAYITI